MERFGSVLLLAGGQSRRMGSDKASLFLGAAAKPLAQELIAQLEPWFSQVLVATGDFAPFAGLDVTLVADRYPGQGPLAGLQAALPQAESEFCYVLACDMPFLDKAYIEALKEKLQASDFRAEGVATRLAGGQIEPFQAFYRQDLAGAMETALQSGQASLTAFCRQRDFLYLDEEEARRHSPDLRLFLNLNRPQDAARWRALQGQDEPVARPFLRPVELLRRDQQTRLMQDLLIEEAPLHLIVQEGERQDRLSFDLLPERLADFVTGQLFCSGRIGSAADVQTFREERDGNQRSVYVTLAKTRAQPQALPARSSTSDLPPPAESAWYASRMQALDEAASLFQASGATHSLALYSRQGEKQDSVEDVSRHAALDKLIGRRLRQGLSFDQLVLFLSCRITATIVRKATACGIRELVSRSAVTGLALDLARQQGLRLWGFVRQGRQNLYL